LLRLLFRLLLLLPLLSEPLPELLQRVLTMKAAFGKAEVWGV
jgi:hypothetical protein